MTKPVAIAGRRCRSRSSNKRSRLGSPDERSGSGDPCAQWPAWRRSADRPAAGAFPPCVETSAGGSVRRSGMFVGLALASLGQLPRLAGAVRGGREHALAIGPENDEAARPGSRLGGRRPLRRTSGASWCPAASRRPTRPRDSPAARCACRLGKGLDYRSGPAGSSTVPWFRWDRPVRASSLRTRCRRPGRPRCRARRAPRKSQVGRSRAGTYRRRRPEPVQPSRASPVFPNRTGWRTAFPC
jgi:hypothetical protein